MGSITDKAFAKNVQRALNELTVRVEGRTALKVDGIFGNGSIALLKLFQNDRGIPVTGQYDRATAGIIDPYIDRRYLTETSFSEAAKKLNVNVASVKAVTTVESKGEGFLADGRQVILFERHIFLRELAKVLPPDQVAKLQAENPDILNKTPGGYVGGVAEWARLERAQAIHQEAALKSASYGLFQIMGFNHKVAGFATVLEYVMASAESETNQLMAFVNFVLANPTMLKALQERNWAKFASLYNGSNYAINQYDKKLAAAYTLYA